jgi:hypothetical protein
LEGKEDEEKKENNERIVKLEFFQNCIFGHILKKNLYIHILVHDGHSSWSTFGLVDLVRGP